MSAKSRSALVALTLGAGPLLISTSAQAAEPTCGQAAQSAVFRTVTVPAVDATYGTDHEWNRTVQDQAAYTDYGWVRELAEYAYTSYQWTRHVVDQPFVAAVPGSDAVTHTEYRWPDLTRQEQYRWSVLTRDFVQGTPAVDEVGHWEYQYQRQVVDQPAQVIQHPAETHMVHHDAVTHEVTVPGSYYSYQPKGNDAKDPSTVGSTPTTDPGRWNLNDTAVYDGSTLNTYLHNGGGNGSWFWWTGVTTTVVDKAAYDEVVVDKAAWTETIPATYTTEYEWSATAPGGDWTIVPGASSYVVTQQAAPAVPDSYTAWTFDTYTDWGSSTTPPVATATVMYGPREDGYTAWQQTGYTDWQKSSTPPAGDDLTSFGTRESRVVEDVPAVPGTPEVPEAGHDEVDWSTSPAVSPWAGSSNVGSPTGETLRVSQDSYVPLAAPFQATGETATDLGWTRDQATPPPGDGWELTGETVSHAAVSHPETAWAPSGQAPKGDGWSTTGASRQGDVVDPGTPASNEKVLVKAAVPAGQACAASAVPATLAFTGFDPTLYAAGGMVLLFVGSGLTVVARRRRD
jgi:hypothetical protein